ncbi:MAG: helix-turn-helix transcriptional regulator [Ruminiclostridium sp.]|nr:helix-turn-helix transcriptional regulator [Ruminiclostridium sp.]
MGTYKRIRDLREDADLTQKQAAERLYMHLTQYRRYESGESEIPMNIAVNIADMYNVSLDYIAGICENKRGLTESTLDAEETKLIKGFRQLSASDRGRILERLEMLTEKDKNKKVQ